ncbi:penicillin-binding protein 2 [Erythrobacter sp. YT30]|uniref:penicillin-binding protein 2 n=1 Tax=Erythrobacter sp. YT30 TaxID=1735012 RepID=UPI000A9EC8AC|nr:penicillin-binding protein 2 [Erythrobacter sp. YT30]
MKNWLTWRSGQPKRRTTQIINASTLKNTFDRRAVVLGGLQGGIAVLLAGRMGYLAIAENEKYRLESESNRVNLTLIPPRRGWILDRNGSPLASNRADFRVDIIPERLDDPEGTINQIGELLQLEPTRIADLKREVSEKSGYQPIEVASGLNFDEFAALSVRLPDLQGVIPQRGFSRYYPTASSVAHLIGYVGPADAEQYAEEDRNPLLLTPGYKIGKDGLERLFEEDLRGKPGGRRVEVTASGRVVRDLETREDTPGDPVTLTIDGPLQDYAARRIGLESGSVVVMDCATGDLLCMASMPSFDPNSFSDGIGSIEYAMLREDERVPLRNKVLQGLYPPGSTIKPMHCMAFLQAGVKPTDTVVCGGGRQIGNRFFRCHSSHGVVDMDKAIAQSCDSYFYHFAQQIGFEKVADMAKLMGMGQQYPLPVASQFYGTVPDPTWKVNKFGEPWRPHDTVNASIGQGYYLASPLQLGVLAARLATGKVVNPRLLLDGKAPEMPSYNFNEDDMGYIRQAMSNVVNGAGTARRAQLPIEGIKLAGKTGTAQVVSLSVSDGRSGPWKYRDHGLFVFFAPFENPRYAGAVVIEHGGGSGSAYPIARDVMTFMFDPERGLEQLRSLEKQWGGTAQQRLERRYAAYAAERGESVTRPPSRDEEIFDRVEAEARLAAAQSEEIAGDAIVPREDQAASGSPPPAAAITGQAPETSANASAPQTPQTAPPQVAAESQTP